MTLEVGRTDDLDACLRLRFAVFVEEQGVPPEVEHDAYDAVATHLLARRDGVALGTARIVAQGGTGKIGRVCVLRSARGLGVGKALIETAITLMRDGGSVERAVLGAQISAIPFYERLGFEAYGDLFDDGGIAHRMMARAL